MRAQPVFSSLLLVGEAALALAYAPGHQVAVFDQVLSPEVASVLHESARSTGLGHRAFARPLRPDGAYGAIERSLDSILTELDGPAPDPADGGRRQYVEYWARQEWRHIEAHADVDEFAAKEEEGGARGGFAPGPDGFRYPTHGHVLYLSVGSSVSGPTCVFPFRRSGGDLLREGDGADEEEATCAAGQQGGVELFVVPARPLRLLRFPGSALHAVPRPHNIWTLPFVMGAPEYEPEEEWGRSVILFNVWEDEPPKGVALNEGVGHEGGGTKDVPVDTAPCRPRSDWQPAPAFDLDGEEGGRVSAKVWLLGNERRRDHAMRTVKLSAPEEIDRILAEKAKVSRVVMGQAM